MAKIVGILCMLFLVFVSKTGAAQTDFSSVAAFGDSLTANDLLGVVYDNPQDLYGADPIEAVFDKNSPAGGKYTSYAVPGSESRHIRYQIDAYLAAAAIGRQKRATLVNFEIGGNDLLNNIKTLAGAAPGGDPAVDGIVRAIKKNIRSSFTRLRSWAAGARFVIWNLPDVTLTPKLWGTLSEVETANVRSAIRRVNRVVRRQGRNADVAVLNLYRFSRSELARPPVLLGHALVLPPAFGGYDCLYADKIHPTAVGNALLANEIVQVMNIKWAGGVSNYTEAELAGLARVL